MKEQNFLLRRRDIFHNFGNTEPVAACPLHVISTLAAVPLANMERFSDLFLLVEAKQFQHLL
jgi:hypothetical protein